MVQLYNVVSFRHLKMFVRSIYTDQGHIQLENQIMEYIL